jgi:hypothetical protein
VAERVRNATLTAEFPVFLGVRAGPVGLADISGADLPVVAVFFCEKTLPSAAVGIEVTGLGDAAGQRVVSHAYTQASLAVIPGTLVTIGAGRAVQRHMEALALSAAIQGAGLKVVAELHQFGALFVSEAVAVVVQAVAQLYFGLLGVAVSQPHGLAEPRTLAPAKVVRGVAEGVELLIDGSGVAVALAEGHTLLGLHPFAVLTRLTGEALGAGVSVGAEGATIGARVAVGQTSLPGAPFNFAVGVRAAGLAQDGIQVGIGQQVWVEQQVPVGLGLPIQGLLAIAGEVALGLDIKGVLAAVGQLVRGAAVTWRGVPALPIQLLRAGAPAAPHQQAPKQQQKQSRPHESPP